MRMRKSERILPMPKPPVKTCECGKPIYDGRRKLCPACAAAVKKINSKRTSTIEKYSVREELLASITDLENAVRMQEWMLQESKKRIVDLKAAVFKIQ